MKTGESGGDCGGCVTADAWCEYHNAVGGSASATAAAGVCRAMFLLRDRDFDGCLTRGEATSSDSTGAFADMGIDSTADCGRRQLLEVLVG